ncbi:MAG: rhodanese-like domain-containing protein [Planctomycetes bacterium]|nr:rhodanese-like domain-containing protein [Planctomycetota bacterium]
MAKISGSSTMTEVLKAYPGAQRALFQKYHIGGCSSCGFQPEDTLQAVLEEHGADPAEIPQAVAFIEDSHTLDQKIQISPKDAAALLKKDAKARLLDVREEWEAQAASIPGASLLTKDLSQEIMAKAPKDTPLLFHCHHGIRSLDAASYFAGHGFTNVRSVTGGIDAWTRDVDPSVPRY